jgi:hypothetical protein
MLRKAPGSMPHPVHEAYGRGMCTGCLFSVDDFPLQSKPLSSGRTEFRMTGLTLNRETQKGCSLTQFENDSMSIPRIAILEFLKRDFVNTKGAVYPF